MKSSRTIKIDDFDVDIRLLWIDKDSPFQGRIAKGVILLIPIYNASERCWSLLEKSLYRLDPLPEKVIFCENNSTDNTLELLDKFQLPHETLIFDREDVPTPKGKFDVLGYARQILLDRARTYGAKMAIFLDDDVIPERPNFIEAFLNDGYDIVSGSYIIIDDKNQNWKIAAFWDSRNPLEDMPAAFSDDDLERIKKMAYVNCGALIGFTDEQFSTDKKHRDGLYRIQLAVCGALALGEKPLLNKKLVFYPISTNHGEDFSFSYNAEDLGFMLHLDYKIKFYHLPPTSHGVMKTRSWL